MKIDPLRIEFSRLASLVRDQMLGFETQVPSRKIAKRFGLEPEEVEMSLDALKYLILHIAKTNCTDEKAFQFIFEQSGLAEHLKDALFEVVKGHVSSLREIMDVENKLNKLQLQTVDWRLSLVTGSRQKQKMMVPKYTLQLQFAEHKNKEDGDENKTSTLLQEVNSTQVMDCDYTMMKRI